MNLTFVYEGKEFIVALIIFLGHMTSMLICLLCEEIQI